MRTRREPEDVKKTADPYLYYIVEGQWQGMIGGVTPARPTVPDHLARLLENEETRLRREEYRKRPSERKRVQPVPATPVAAEQATEAEAATLADAAAAVPSNDRGNADEAVVNEAVQSQRRQWLERLRSYEGLDEDARRQIEEALQELSPIEMLVRTTLRMTNTFPRGTNGNFVVPATWFYGGLKAALMADGAFPDQARNLVKRCVVVYPEAIDLGTNKEDTVHNANITLDRTGPGEAQASIKRFHLVKPREPKFTIVIKVLDSPTCRVLTENMIRTMTIVGEAGLGGGRPQFGRFGLLSCTAVSSEAGRVVIDTLNAMAPKLAIAVS